MLNPIKEVRPLMERLYDELQDLKEAVITLTEQQSPPAAGPHTRPQSSAELELRDAVLADARGMLNEELRQLRRELQELSLEVAQMRNPKQLEAQAAPQLQQLPIPQLFSCGGKAPSTTASTIFGLGFSKTTPATGTVSSTDGGLRFGQAPSASTGGTTAGASAAASTGFSFGPTTATLALPAQPSTPSFSFRPPTAEGATSTPAKYHHLQRRDLCPRRCTGRRNWIDWCRRCGHPGPVGTTGRRNWIDWCRRCGHPGPVSTTGRRHRIDWCRRCGHPGPVSTTGRRHWIDWCRRCGHPGPVSTTGRRHWIDWCRRCGHPGPVSTTGRRHRIDWCRRCGHPGPVSTTGRRHWIDWCRRWVVPALGQWVRLRTERDCGSDGRDLYCRDVAKGGGGRRGRPPLPWGFQEAPLKGFRPTWAEGPRWPESFRPESNWPKSRRRRTKFTRESNK
ncbi:hypothetical protein FJT64_012697 [Amphibalanus amphitrite]|uniref:Uncharacterized protein n=1 Tax=Amphibalanus amphitrite TaxID=1232801 RepID=A0A6A4V2U4_AMPAM|nr:hypothetical protein FJT64_012697 [Amphibalanus amphitrite]